MKHNKNLTELIELCKQGNRNAQHKLFELYKNRMFALCMRYSKSNTEAEDMLMEGFMRIFNYLNSYEISGSFEAWMKRVMINNAINTYKANIKHNNIEHEHIEKINSDIFQKEYIFTEEELMQCVQKLPNSLRVIFNLSAIDEYSNKEISEILNMNSNSIKSNLYKARKHLKDQLEELVKTKSK